MATFQKNVFNRRIMLKNLHNPGVIGCAEKIPGKNRAPSSKLDFFCFEDYARIKMFSCLESKDLSARRQEKKRRIELVFFLFVRKNVKDFVKISEIAGFDRGAPW